MHPTTKKTSPQTTFFDGTLACPFCGCQDVHIGPVCVQQHDQATYIERRRTVTRPAEPCGRGSRVTTTFHCEDGHTFDVTYRFSKGTTFVSVSDPRPARWDASPPKTLWRD